MLKKLSELREIVKTLPRKKLVVAVAQDEHSLEAVMAATEMKVIDPILVGDRIKIEDIAEEKKIDISKAIIIDEPNVNQAVAKAVKLVHFGEAEILMKGKVGSATLLKGVLDKEWGLRKNPVISHIALFEVPAYHHKLIALTDVAMNIAPDLTGKVNILNNAIEFLNKLG